MKIRLTTNIDSGDYAIPAGTLGEVLHFEAVADVVYFTCVFYGYYGVREVPHWDVESVR